MLRKINQKGLASASSPGMLPFFAKDKRGFYFVPAKLACRLFFPEVIKFGFGMVLYNYRELHFMSFCLPQQFSVFGTDFVLQIMI